MYCTIADILEDIDRNELIKLVDDENRSGLVNLDDANDYATKRIIAAIDNSSEQIDGALRGRYTLPLASIPKRLTQICKDIAIYNLYKRRFRLDMPESINQIYKNCISELDKIRKGAVTLDISESVTDATSGFIKTNERTKFFNYEL